MALAAHLAHQRGREVGPTCGGGGAGGRRRWLAVGVALAAVLPPSLPVPVALVCPVVLDTPEVKLQQHPHESEQGGSEGRGLNAVRAVARGLHQHTASLSVRGDGPWPEPTTTGTTTGTTTVTTTLATTAHPSAAVGARPLAG